MGESSSLTTAFLASGTRMPTPTGMLPRRLRRGAALFLGLGLVAGAAHAEAPEVGVPYADDFGASIVILYGAVDAKGMNTAVAMTTRTSTAKSLSTWPARYSPIRLNEKAQSTVTKTR